MTCHRPLTADPLTLIRPRLLVQTARIGASLYRRERDMAVDLPANADKGAILARLRQSEQSLEDLRQARAAHYRAARHVQVLSALIAESGTPAPRAA